MANSEVRGSSPEQIVRHLTSRRRFVQGAGIAMASAAIWTPGLAQATGAPTRIGLRSRAQSAGQLTYASARPLFTFDPRLVQTTEEMGLMQHVCEPLVRLDAQMNLTPGLATAWEPVDATTWKFTLQSGVTFSNGEPFDAEAVKFSMEEYQRTGEAYPWFYLWPGELPQVEVVDPQTVLFKSSVTIGAAPRNLAILFMLPPKATANGDFAQKPVGTGPYTVTANEQDERLELTANPTYWGGAPAIQTITYRPIPDPSARMVSIQTGEIDVAGSIPPDLVPTLRDSADLTIYQEPGVRIAHYPFNFRRTDSPIADPRVRHALGLAIDGPTIVQAILAGAGQELKGPVPSILFGAADLGGYPPADPEQAKALLAEAGYPADYELHMIFSPGEFIKDREVTEAVQGMLDQAGVKLRIEELEGGAYSERRTTADWEVAINGFSAMNGDPGFFLAWATGPTTFGYNNQATKDVIEQALETVDETERKSQLEQAQKAYWDDAPYLWGYTQTDTVAVNNRVSGVQPLSTGWISFQAATLAK